MLPATVRIFVCTSPQDMRRSFDRLSQCVRELVGEEPQSGAMFVFASKSRRRVKVLWWDKNGYCLLYKRLHQALFEMPPAGDGAASVRIDGAALAKLLAGVARVPTK